MLPKVPNFLSKPSLGSYPFVPLIPKRVPRKSRKEKHKLAFLIKTCSQEAAVSRSLLSSFPLCLPPLPFHMNCLAVCIMLAIADAQTLSSSKTLSPHSMTLAASFFFPPYLFYPLYLFVDKISVNFSDWPRSHNSPRHSLPKCWDPGCTATPGSDISSQWQHCLAGCFVPGGNSTNLSRPPCTPPTDDHDRRSRDDNHRVPGSLRPQVSGVV